MSLNINAKIQNGVKITTRLNSSLNSDTQTLPINANAKIENAVKVTARVNPSNGGDAQTFIVNADTKNSVKLTASVKTLVNNDAQTFLLVDEYGNEVVATLVDEFTLFTATPNDIRLGTVAATDSGVTVGEKLIPSYVTTEGYRIITKGGKFETNPLEKNLGYDFTKFQALVCPYAKNIAGSVATEKVAIDGGVYAVNSTERISTVEKNSETKRISLGITNDSGSLYLLRYFTYKEIY